MDKLGDPDTRKRFDCAILDTFPERDVRVTFFYSGILDKPILVRVCNLSV